MTQEIILKVDDVEIYENDIELAIAEACEQFQIEDLKKERQRPWKAVMRYVGFKVFPDRVILKDKSLNLYNNNIIPTNSNKYDYDILNSLFEYYCYLSDRYSKLISAVAFSYFINIPVNTIDVWGGTEPSSPTFKIWKKIQDARRDCITDDAFDNGNVTGTMFVGNVEFGMNLPGVSREMTTKQQISTQDALRLVAELSQDQRKALTDQGGGS